MASTRSWWPIGAMVSGLVVVNAASNELVPRDLYVPFAIVSAVVAVAVARGVDRLSWDALGFGRRYVAAGLRWGGAVAAVVLVVLVVGVALPSTRELFEDRRVMAMSAWEALYAAFVRVPLGTVLLEEVAFRGVLPAMLSLRIGRWRAIGVSAVLFGLWHVLPSLDLGTVNPVATETVGDVPRAAVSLASVVSTAAVGVWFSFLRERSGSLVAPMLAHWSSNGLGYLFAYAVINWG